MRLQSLDSVRGVAALIVVFYHASLVFPGPQPWWITRTPLRLLLAGPAAVLVFFVLSGVVLAMTFIYRDGERYGPYVTKRVSRIWVPFAASIILSAALQAIAGNAPVQGASGWFGLTWNMPLTVFLVTQHLAMTGMAINLNNPMWSLCHEMRISLLFPLLVFATMRKPTATLVVSILVMAITVKAQGLLPINVFREQLSTLSYVFLFVVGILIARQLDGLRHGIEAMTPAWRGALWVAALLLLCAAPDNTSHVAHLREAIWLLLTGIGAAMIPLLSIAEGKPMALLLGKVPQYLGRVSYSLYLVHVPILAFVVRLVSPAVNLAFAVGLAILAAILTAEVFHRIVEVQSRSLGRHLANTLFYHK